MASRFARGEKGKAIDVCVMLPHPLVLDFEGFPACDSFDQNSQKTNVSIRVISWRVVFGTGGTVPLLSLRSGVVVLS